MREIRFRAWDGEKMVSPDYIDRRGRGWWKEDSIPTSSATLMQFTGLQDKNGVDIFEGDIVLCVNGHKGIIEWEANDCCFNVEGYYDPSNDYPTMAFIEGQPFEVIGNIHESPELAA